MSTTRTRLHHLALLLVVGGLTVAAGCARQPDPLEAIKRPKTYAPSAPLAPTPAPAPAPTAPKPPDAAWFRPRSAWAAQQIDVGKTDPMVEPIYRITVHHSGDADDATSDPVERLRQFERFHKAEKGWACIGYHFIIARDGTVFEGRPIRFQGAHATGDNNIGNIGICLMGNFDKRPIPASQREALQRTVDRLRQQYGIKRDAVFGHRDFKTTDCPGRFGMEWVEAYRDNKGG